METKRCVACGQNFRPRPQNPEQSYCPAPACQRERRRRWQRNKRHSDPDYRDNQSQAQRAWLERHPTYYGDFRATHPECVEHNRIRQRERRSEASARRVAKMDASTPVLPLFSGVYHLTQAHDDGVAKMDVWKVKITLISDT